MFHVEQSGAEKPTAKTRREANEFEKIRLRKQNLRMWGRFRVKL